MKTLKALVVITLFFATILGENLVAQDCIYCEGIPDGIKASQIGPGSTAQGTFSVAIGSAAHTYSNAVSSIAIGQNVIAIASSCFVLGFGESPIRPLTNNVQHSLMLGFNSELPTFFVGNSPSYDKTGKVAIGNMTEPEAKLHIFSDEDENATLYLQPSIWDVGYNAEIWLGNQNHGVSANTTEGMAYKTEINHVFKGGDVYIEDIDKGIIMKSPDGRCWRGTLYNSGMLVFTELESCPELITNVTEPGIPHTNESLKVYPNPTEQFLTIELENSSQTQLTISLLSEKGVELKRTLTTTSKIQFYTGDLKPGVYFVKVVGNGQKLVSKVIRK